MTGNPLFEDWTLHVHERDHICLVGKNGCGKSTLLKVLSSQMEVDTGLVYVQPGLRVAYLAQRLTDAKEDDTAFSYITRYAAQDYMAHTYLMHLKIAPEKLISVMSGGEQRRLSLAATLCQEPDVLLLDEPTNHLDIESIEWLEGHLKNWRGAYIVISHDRQFLKSISNKTWWIDRGVVHENAKGFEDFEGWSQFIWDEEEKQKAVLDTKLRQEARWMLRGVTARRKRNQGRLRKVLEMREQRREMALNTRKSIDATAFQNKSASQLVANIESVNKSFGNRQVVKDFSFRLMKGDRIGIVGPNGIGKSTLIKLMIGKLAPDSGNVQLNDTLEVVYLDQMQESLDLQKTVADNVCESGGDHVVVGDVSKHIVAYLKDFLFFESQIKGMTHILSGGERNRLALAKAMTKPCDLLVLDEPTNDLDTDTLDLLTELLTEFKGTLLIISHDRDFLDQTVTSLIAFDEQGCAKEYIGGYQDYLRQRTHEIEAKTLKNKGVGNAKGESQPLDTNEQQSTASKAKNRLSYKQKRSYEMLPNEIDELTSLITGLENQLQDPAFYQTNPEGFVKLTCELEKAKQLRDEKEVEWLELDELMSV